MFSSEEEKRRFNHYMESIKKSDIPQFKPFEEPNPTPIGNIVDSAIKKIDYLLDVLRFGTKK